MSVEKYRKIFKGNLPDLIHFFNEKYQGDKFESNFELSEAENLPYSRSLTSNILTSKLYRSPDGFYVLVEVYFPD